MIRYTTPWCGVYPVTFSGGFLNSFFPDFLCIWELNPGDSSQIGFFPAIELVYFYFSTNCFLPTLSPHQKSIFLTMMVFLRSKPNLWLDVVGDVSGGSVLPTPAAPAAGEIGPSRGPSPGVTANTGSTEGVAGEATS